jgi:hypothetical protein
MVIGTQAVGATLIWLGISVGVVVLLGLAFVASVAYWQRYDRKEHINALERYLAVVGRRRDEQRPTHTS